MYSGAFSKVRRLRTIRGKQQPWSGRSPLRRRTTTSQASIRWFITAPTNTACPARRRTTSCRIHRRRAPPAGTERQRLTMATTITEPRSPVQLNDSGTGGGSGSFEDGFSGGNSPREYRVPDRTYRLGTWLALVAVLMLFAAFTSA